VVAVLAVDKQMELTQQRILAAVAVVVVEITQQLMAVQAVQVLLS
jgi:hypothetical protein